MKVCKKVEEKGQTTYNEVADEIVREFLSSRPLLSTLSPEAKKPKGQYDDKNIRRRVYDALNVLMAMDIISKEVRNSEEQIVEPECVNYASNSARTTAHAILTSLRSNPSCFLAFARLAEKGNTLERSTIKRSEG